MDFNEIRKLTITALFSDDILLEQIVLKGGNAVSLVYGYTVRSSLDLDFSIEGDFEDFEDTKTRLFRALENRFSSVGLVAFDLSFERKPSALNEGHPNWGGYILRFKVIENEKHSRLKDLGDIRRNALVVGPAELRTFTVQLSKFEYCTGKAEVELDYYTIYVYTPAMIVAEKLRAICQQMPEYGLRSHSTPRARDFYDIHQLITKAGVVLSERDSMQLLTNIFAAKNVPVSLIARIQEQKEFHRLDWPSVQISVLGDLEEFDFYFDFVVNQVSILKSLWGK